MIKKNVRNEELKINIIASMFNIAPKILDIKKLEDNRYEITSERYPLTLLKIPEEERAIYTNKIKNKVKKLHSLGIIHGDIHEDNIVVNREKDKVGLIDFGLSKNMPCINKKYLKEFTIYGEKSPKSIEELLELELKEVDFITK
jgi:serine/threonine protein kinase